MPADTRPVEAGNVPVRVPKKGRKAALVTLDDIDRRTTASRRVREVMASIESDLGGSDHLSTAQRILVQRIAVQSAIIESQEAAWARGEAIDTGALTTMVNALRRNLETIGLQRIARDATLTLEQYVASRYGQADADDAAEAE